MNSVDWGGTRILSCIQEALLSYQILIKSLHHGNCTILTIITASKGHLWRSYCGRAMSSWALRLEPRVQQSSLHQGRQRELNVDPSVRVAYQRPLKWRYIGSIISFTGVINIPSASDLEGWNSDFEGRLYQQAVCIIYWYSTHELNTIFVYWRGEFFFFCYRSIRDRVR